MEIWTKEKVEKLLTELVAKELKINLQDVNPKAEFYQLGLDSLGAMYILDQLEKRLEREINPLLFWEYPTIESFSEKLLQQENL